MKSRVLAEPKAEKIVMQRAIMGLSIVEFAKKCNVHFTTLSAIETGRSKKVTPKVAHKIAIAMGKTVDELFVLKYVKEV